MGDRRSRNILLALLMVGILLLLVPVQEAIHKSRPLIFSPNRVKSTSTISIGPAPAVIAALGGFRTVAADLLWLQAERMWDGGSWWAMLPLLDAVTQLDPHFILAWQVYGWHAAYNMNAESETIVDKRYWLDRGVKILEQAVDANPDNWEMIFEMGWTLYDRAHQPWRAAEYFRRADKLQGSKSYVTRLIYRCYERVLDFKELFPALEYAINRHNDPNIADDVQHQVIVHRDYEWWKQHRDDPAEHRRQIVLENTARAERAVPFYLYPDDPYWDVCPLCGMPSPKGSDTCSVCGAPLKQLKARQNSNLGR
jgi:tetratricopeptide (TPR) repeat protein